LIVIWTREAEQDRTDIWDFIATDSAIAAAKMDELFSTAAERLTDYPQLGKPGEISGTRELIPHENYRLVYEVDRHAIWVLALIHTSRCWPPV
jgi:addiction module RelE/StbE family toxin